MFQLSGRACIPATYPVNPGEPGRVLHDHDGRETTRHGVHPRLVLQRKTRALISVEAAQGVPPPRLKK